jgi:hypothetical protein
MDTQDQEAKVSFEKVSPGFLEAMIQTMKEHEALGDVASDDMTESATMRAVGIERSDAVRLAESFMLTYGRSLATGWTCPECGLVCEEDGTCPDGHEFDVHLNPATRRMETMVSLTELALAIGVNLERARWTEMLRIQDAGA